MFAVRVGDRFLNLDRLQTATWVPAEGALYLTGEAFEQRLEGDDATRVLAILDRAAEGAEASLRVMAELAATEGER